MDHCVEMASARWSSAQVDFIVEAYRRDALEHGRSLMRQAPSWSSKMLLACRQHIDAIQPHFRAVLEETIESGGATLDRIVESCGLTPAPWPTEQKGAIHDGRLLTMDEFCKRSADLAKAPLE